MRARSKRAAAAVAKTVFMCMGYGKSYGNIAEAGWAARDGCRVFYVVQALPGAGRVLRCCAPPELCLSLAKRVAARVVVAPEPPGGCPPGWRRTRSGDACVTVLEGYMSRVKL